MEKELFRVQFEKRLSGTALRLNCLAAVAALLPIVLRMATMMYLAGVVVIFLILIAAAAATAFLLFLNEKFLELFYFKDAQAIVQTADSIMAGYRIAMPILLAVSAVLTFLAIFFSLRAKEQMYMKKRVIIAAVCFACVVIFAVVFYTRLAEGIAA